MNREPRPRVLNLLLRLHGLPPIRRDHAHIDPADWQDTKARDGAIVTHCRRCGAFIGRRPVPAAPKCQDKVRCTEGLLE